MNNKKIGALALAFCLGNLNLQLTSLPAFAGDTQQPCGHCRIDYTRLDLTSDQSNKIQALDRDFQEKYQQIKPAIVENQQKVKRLMASPQSDATEIMMVQQKIDDLQGELRRFAAQILIKKKDCLNPTQKERLEQMIKEELIKRGQDKGGVQANQVPQRWQKLIRGVEGIFNPDSK